MALTLLQKYKRRLEFLGLAAGSKYRYTRIVEMYLHHSKGKLSRETVEGFVTLHKGTSGTYRRFIMGVLKGLFGVAEVGWPFSPRELPKVSTPYRPFFTVEDAQRLLDAARRSPIDYALIRVAASTGCRREELSRMLVEDYVPPRLTVRTAKGGDRRVRTLDSETVQAVDSYLRGRGSRSSHLFLSENGIPLSPTTLGNRFRRIARQAGFKDIGWHGLRRGVTTWLFEAGMREKELQELIGWKSLAMPAQYVQLVPGRLEEKAQEMHPFSRGQKESADGKR